MKRFFTLLLTAVLLIVPALDVGAAGRQVITEINPILTGGRRQVTAHEVPESADGGFQACDEVIDGFADFKLAMLRHLRAKDTDFSICFQTQPSEQYFLTWWDQLSTDQDISWLTNSWSEVRYRYSYNATGVSQATYSLIYWHNQQEEIQLEAAVRDQVRQLITPDMDLPTREKIIHDWVVKHVTYDQTYQNYSDYQAFFAGSAVCQGYSLLVDRMLSMAGIEDRIVTGTTANGGDHAWNLVNLCGDWFHLDATFDDPIGMGPDYIRWQYFNCTDAAMRSDHNWTVNDYPAAAVPFVNGSCLDTGAGACSIFTPWNCLTETQCINVSGNWANMVCSVPGSDPGGGGGNAGGGSSLAAPPQAMVAETFSPTVVLNPGETIVPVSAGPLLLQPKLTVSGSDWGRSASLFIYIYLPGSNSGFNYSGPRVTLENEVSFAPIFPDAVDLSNQHHFIFDVYCGYVLDDGTIRYNAYEVWVDVLNLL